MYPHKTYAMLEDTNTHLNYIRRIKQTDSKYLNSLKSYNIFKSGYTFFGGVIYTVY